MRSRIALIATIATLLGLLILLNAASYVSKSSSASDSELNPDRSSYHEGSTGTKGLYEFLQESDYRAVRWRKSLVALMDASASRPQVLLMIGPISIPLEQKESAALSSWVATGGRLVIVDREPATALKEMLAGWDLTSRLLQTPDFSLDEETPESLTKGVASFAPAQPTIWTRKVKTITPSRYAARFTLVAINNADTESAEPESAEPLPTTEPEENEESPPSSAPVVHFSDDQGALLIDHVYGDGRVILLSDPFIFANNGIEREDNLQLALNMLGGRDNLIAFDEYHHGHGAGTRETLITYFAGTPLPSLVAQLMLLVLAFAWARSKRFARALPAAHTDRRSKLEFITSMAELQMRARAFDLALENIYARTHRLLARTSGTEPSASRERIAARISSQRGRVSKEELEKIMRACEDAIAGAPTSGKQALYLASELRRIERQL